jgi:hypothetical protein
MSVICFQFELLQRGQTSEYGSGCLPFLSHSLHHIFPQSLQTRIVVMFFSPQFGHIIIAI